MKQKMDVWIVLVVLLGVLPLKVQGQFRVQPGAKIFIDKMESGLDGFLAAEILKQKLPVLVVTDETAAEYVLTGGSIKGDDKWYHSVLGTGKDKNEGNVQLMSVRDKALVWAGEAGDRSLWFNSLKRGGQRKVADRLISQMNHDLFRK